MTAAGNHSEQRTPPRFVRAFIFGQALLYLAAILKLTGLVAEWGEWYSPHLAHRIQTSALLSGRLQMSGNPLDLKHDYAWSEGGVQQVWGLGVPAFRTPFEFMARCLGFEAFPDRIVIGIALLGMVVFTLHLFLRDAMEQYDRPRVLWATAITSTLIAFPPFLNLLRARFQVYEEVLAYVYIWGILEALLLYHLSKKGSAFAWLALSFMAGWGAFVRPTLFLYGLLSLPLGAWCFIRRSTSSLRRTIVAVGVMIFLAGGGALYVTNQIRFGQGFEFGHKLNLQSPLLLPSMYATRFDHPFAKEPILSAAAELFGAMFLKAPELDRWWYNTTVFPMQSPTVRMREISFTTYDVTFALLLTVSWAWVLLGGNRFFGKNPPGDSNDPEFSYRVLTLWSCASAFLLAAFYLRTSVIASRYLIDFAPSFAIGIAAFIGRLAIRKEHKLWIPILFFFWMVLELKTARSLSPLADATRWEYLAPRLAQALNPNPPRLKSSSETYNKVESSIPFDGNGWDRTTGRVQPIVAIFVQDPHGLELDVVALSNGDPQMIRAKIDLEELERDTIQKTDARRFKIRFKAPKQMRYQSGLHVAFIAFAQPDDLASEQTAWILLSASWGKGLLPLVR